VSESDERMDALRCCAGTRIEAAKGAEVVTWVRESSEVASRRDFWRGGMAAGVGCWGRWGVLWWLRVQQKFGVM
jgi:hypothetical protein